MTARAAPLLAAIFGAATCVALGSVAGCGGPVGPSSPAADGVRAYLRALESDDARAAYDLLTEHARKELSFDEFELQWKQSEKERQWQLRALQDGVKGNPEVGERAAIHFPDGKLVQLEREGRAWRLESELVTRTRAKRPRDAVRLFADAIAQRDLEAVLGVLTERRRTGLMKQVEGFVAGIGKRVNHRIDLIGTERAELRWDENGIRYRIVLRKEADEWRVDDIYIRPAPRKDAEDDTVVDELPDGF